MEPFTNNWDDPRWLTEVHGWIERALQQSGRSRIGAIEQPHIRPWSTVLRATTDAGVVFFKAVNTRLTDEPKLTLALANLSPECMPEIIAADLPRGWMLTCDAGSPLRQRLNTPADLALVDPILPMLAGVQKQWLGRQDELVQLGAFDGRVEALPHRFEGLTRDATALMAGQPDGLSEAQIEQLHAAIPLYHEWSGRLLECNIPQSIHYDDMHTSNVFLREDRNGAARVTFSDWGDSSAGHPFCSMLIFLRSIADCMHLPDAATETPETLDPMLARLRDRYLAAWQEYDTYTNLLEAFNLAWRVGMVARALSWNSSINDMDEKFRSQYRYTVPAWLGEFLLTLPWSN